MRSVTNTALDAAGFATVLDPEELLRRIKSEGRRRKRW
jgi:hypothetical protein